MIALNAFYVAAEMALARVRRTRIDHLVEQGNRAAVLAQRALNNPDRFISACQLGITLATLALGALGEQAFAEDLSEYIRYLGLLAQWPAAVSSAATAICYIAAFSLTAFLQTVFGELLPKTLAFPRAEPILLTLVWPMEAWCFITSPFLKVLNGFTALVLRVFNIKEPPRHHFVHSEEELKMLVSASHEEGVLESEEQEMLHSVFDFSDTVASEVMTPKRDMVCMPASATVKEFVQEALAHGLSRLPVFEEDEDSIFGMVHIRDALRALMEHKEVSQIREFVRKVLIVPENKSVGDLLAEFRKTKTHMAIIVDEYGGTRGLVTIEDLIEELVGDIADEHEVVEEFVQEQEDGTIIVDAKISLDEVEERLGLEIEDEEFNTLGGHVFGKLGREPQVGDEIVAGGFSLRVEEADRHRIMKLRLRQIPPAEIGDGEGELQGTAQAGGGTEELRRTSELPRVTGGGKSRNDPESNGQASKSVEASK